MMGRQVEPEQLFYDFCFEAHIPADHLLRKVDAALDLGFVGLTLRDHYSHTGRPSVDPELMIRMLLVGYLFAIRSERRLCEEVHLNLAYRWFCRIGLEGKVPDQSTFSKNRHGCQRRSKNASAGRSDNASGVAGRRLRWGCLAGFGDQAWAVSPG
jgi:transposase